MTSAIIGAAELYDCTPNEEYQGCYDHCMQNPFLFKKFIPGVSGARNYWQPKTSAHIKAFNLAWERIQDQAPYLVEPSLLPNSSPRILITPPPKIHR